MNKFAVRVVGSESCVMSCESAELKSHNSQPVII